MVDRTSAADTGTLTRRTFIRGSAATVAGTAAVAGAGTAGAQEDRFDGWFDDVDNYDGVVDAAGQGSVTIEVGTDANGGAFGFGPPAVRVSPGTTVVWEWTGNGGAHNVAAEAGSFESETTAETGHTFEQTFAETGVIKYVCAPHRAVGMKGAIVVEESDAGGGRNAADATGSGDTLVGEIVTGGLASVVIGILLLLPVSELRQRRESGQ